jgi:hypothetical protein
MHLNIKPEIRQYLWLYSFISPILFVITVIVLGLITPNYNHFSHTISRLAIEKYGWIAQLNLFQFGISLVINGLIFTQIFTARKSQKIWLVAFFSGAILTFLIVIFPTDPINDVRTIMKVLSWHGFIHFIALILFFTLSPFGINLLRYSQRSEKSLSQLADFTGNIGYTVCGLCLLWIIFFIMGILTPYKGLFQKVIAGICIYWLLRMLWSVRKTNYIQNK